MLLSAELYLSSPPYPVKFLRHPGLAHTRNMDKLRAYDVKYEPLHTLRESMAIVRVLYLNSLEL